MRAIRPRQKGGPEVLVLTELPNPTPSPGEALVRVEAPAPQRPARRRIATPCQGGVRAWTLRSPSSESSHADS